jgi:hypothetical protein
MMHLIFAATADVSEQLRKTMTSLMPEGLSSEDAPGEKGHFTACLPHQPSAPGEEANS